MLKHVFWACIFLSSGCAGGDGPDSTSVRGDTSNSGSNYRNTKFDGDSPEDSVMGSDVETDPDGAASIDSQPIGDASIEADTSIETDAEGQPRPDGAMPIADDAEMVLATLPSEMNCRDVFAAEVTIRNTGQATWSRMTDYKLGAVDDSDPFYSRDTRVWLPPEAIVSPGETFAFSFELTAPEEAGVYVTDWQMVHEGVAWFGGTVSEEVVVSCPIEPDPGVRAPLPDESAMVDQLANERPDLLEQSCIEDGGNNDFLFELVRRLRARDTRWGLNWKRGNEGDMSQDIVNYYWPPGEPVEGSTDVYPIDVIAGHCPRVGDPPSSPTWIDQTQATADAGAIGRWTIRPLPR